MYEKQILFLVNYKIAALICMDYLPNECTNFLTDGAAFYNYAQIFSFPFTML